jgi:hypothetical protein
MVAVVDYDAAEATDRTLEAGRGDVQEAVDWSELIYHRSQTMST